MTQNKANDNAFVDQTEVRQLHKFNKTIQITVDVDTIAKKLCDSFPADYKHKELVTEAIIGTACHSNTIDYIYNALNGYSADIDFKVGDKIICTEGQRRVNEFEVQKSSPDMTQEAIDNMKPIYKTYKHVEIGECEVVEIDLYRSEKLKVKYMQDSYRSQEQEEDTAWVNHRQCTKLS